MSPRSVLGSEPPLMAMVNRPFLLTASLWILVMYAASASFNLSTLGKEYKTGDADVDMLSVGRKQSVYVQLGQSR